MSRKLCVASFSLILFASCGRPASDIVHAPIRDENRSLDDGNRGNLDNSRNNCAAGQILLSQSRESPICVTAPQPRVLSAVSLWAFWNTSTTERCADIASFVKAFQRTHMPSAQISLTTCKAVTRTEKAIFVGMEITSPSGTHREAFEVAGSQNDAAVIRICTSERTQYIENKHCSEIFRPARIPMSLAAVAPKPDVAMIDFYPTLWSLLSN